MSQERNLTPLPEQSRPKKLTQKERERVHRRIILRDMRQLKKINLPLYDEIKDDLRFRLLIVGGLEEKFRNSYMRWLLEELSKAHEPVMLNSEESEALKQGSKRNHGVSTGT